MFRCTSLLPKAGTAIGTQRCRITAPRASSLLHDARPLRSLTALCQRPRYPVSQLSNSHRLERVRLVQTPPSLSQPMEPGPPDWWHRRLPKWTIPYLALARMDRPAGTHLLFLPCAWSIGMATYASILQESSALAAQQALGTMGFELTLFYIGAVVMRGAGCTINDMWDRDLDQKVERTRSRPIASNQVTQFQALVFLGAQLSVGLAVLLQLNWYSIILGASSLGLVIIYPLMKRITHWPQAVLGLAFNWGALLGWSAVAGVCNWTVCLPLYLSGWCWTLVYDTIYALQDRDDDRLAGVKSTALRFGDNVKWWISGFAAASTALVALAGYLNGHGPLFYAFGVAGAAFHYGKLIWGLRVDDRADAGKRFRGSRQFGVLVAAGVLLDIGWRFVVD
ncbi:4-hydroxybenzoate polyprenyl transferase [Zopfochytrium polystomum]|nr:4-hydroxybenzoate polyprenyl transferase [Zopfochytrium polystomum]KAI9355325.1 4-hydroxybenzoate polyprenyl transferase [Zopfochytrium polystomum]